MTVAGGYLSATNHGVLMSEVSKRSRLPEMRVPLLVIHGTADPVFPIEHGIALSTAVPGDEARPHRGRRSRTAPG